MIYDLWFMQDLDSSDYGIIEKLISLKLQVQLPVAVLVGGEKSLMHFNVGNCRADLPVMWYVQGEKHVMLYIAWRPDDLHIQMN